MSHEKITLKDFRRRVVAGTFPVYPDVSSALHELGFVQADPIRSPARAQDLILRQRVPDYQAGDLERCFPDADAEEGFLFAYGFMRPDVWQDLRRGKPTLTPLEEAMLAFVKERGEVHPRGLDERFGKESTKNYWGGKGQATKRVLEDLHEVGLLRVCRREKGIRVYQVPKTAQKDASDPAGCYARLLMATAHVFGPAAKRFLLSELRGAKKLIATAKERGAIVDQLVDTGQLSEVDVDGVSYLWIREAWRQDEVPDRVRLLAPFDPLVRDRVRFEQLWGWSYRFEAYVPAAKRERGYYAMPLLWRDEVIGWANAKVTGKRLEVDLGYVERPPRAKAFRVAFEAEVEEMTRFLGLESGEWEVTSGSG